MTPDTFAHAGHWLVQIAYLLPLGALGVAVLLGKRRERRERRGDREVRTPKV